MMVRMEVAAQVHETNFSREIPDGISSRTVVLYRRACRGTVRSDPVTMRYQAAGHPVACPPFDRAGYDAARWLEEVSRP
jgi:hypothetical protein